MNELLPRKRDGELRVPAAVGRLLREQVLTARTARDTGYLLSGLFTGIAAFTLVVTAASTALGLSLVIFGLPLAVAAVFLNRAWCGVERRRAGRVLGRTVGPNYRPLSEGSRIARWLSVFGDAQTWRDALWMLLSLPVGVLGFTIAVAAWSATAALLTSPVYNWSIPGWISSHDVVLSILGPLLAVPAAILATWLVRGSAVAQATLAASLLGPPRSSLEHRVQSLSETRAGALDAAVSELQRVERDLHDGAQARLVALAMDLGLAEQRLTHADAETALEHVAAARVQARAAMAELRDLVRGIGPSILQDRGLDAALTALVAGGNPPVELYVQIPHGRVGARETAAYFVVAEALTNVRKHACATRAWVRVWEHDERRLLVEVVDNGRGGAGFEHGSGLTGLRKRVAALDGTLELDSPPGGPTTVRAELP